MGIPLYTKVYSVMYYVMSFYRVNLKVTHKETKGEFTTYYYEHNNSVFNPETDLRFYDCDNIFNHKQMHITAIINGVRRDLEMDQLLLHITKLTIVSCTVKAHRLDDPFTHTFRLRQHKTKRYRCSCLSPNHILLLLISLCLIFDWKIFALLLATITIIICLIIIFIQVRGTVHDGTDKYYVL